MKIPQIFKCKTCNVILEILAADKNFNCCGKDMETLEPKTQDEGQEKHVPVIEKTEQGIKVKVGDIPHPMEDEHFIQFIEIIADNKVYRQELKPGQEPEAEFPIHADNIIAREYCNIHGLWQS